MAKDQVSNKEEVMEAPKRVTHDEVQCTRCGQTQERNAQPGQTLQPSPNYVCEDCNDELNVPAFKAELAEAENDPNVPNARKAFLKSKIRDTLDRVAEREAKAERSYGGGNDVPASQPDDVGGVEK